MLFNSLAFVIFFSFVYAVYLLLGHRWQNRFLLLASWIFYSCWDWRFLGLLLLSSLIAYVCGFQVAPERPLLRRRFFMGLSICTDLGILGFFKYYNFFATSLVHLFSRLGFHPDAALIAVVLPVGISFYTFHTISYIIDVHRGTVRPCRSFVDFALFVSYFPQLVAGPIARASALLPQVQAPRQITREKIAEGAYLIFWGLFQKIVVADNLSFVVDSLFTRKAPYGGLEVLLGAYSFAFQIYADFCGYSNMARGLAKLMGFELTLNFRRPYFSAGPSEFWRRWHISLSTWLRDYLYIPLGGNRGGRIHTFANLFVTMLLGGLWHGANWTFVVWGAYHGLLLTLQRWMNPTLKEPSRLIRWAQVAIFFHLVCLGWIIFRANSISQFFEMCHGLVAGWDLPRDANVTLMIKSLVVFCPMLLLVEAFEEFKDDAMAVLRLPSFARAAVYYLIFYSLTIFGVTGAQNFVYFQF